MTTPTETHYTILNVEWTATEIEIRKGYKLQALKWHPDRVEPSQKDEATEQFKKISEAYQVLSDKNKRLAYDAKLRAGAATPSGEVPLSPEDLFNKEFSEVLKEVAIGIGAQRGEGNRVVPTVSMSVIGGYIGYFCAAALAAPYVVPMTVGFGVAGAIRGYTGKSVVSVYFHLDEDTQRRVLEVMLKQQQRYNQGDHQ